MRNPLQVTWTSAGEPGDYFPICNLSWPGPATCHAERRAEQFPGLHQDSIGFIEHWGILWSDMTGSLSKKVRTITWEKFGIWTLLLCFNVTACCVGWRADDGRGKIGWQRGGGWEQIDPYCSTFKGGLAKKRNRKTGLILSSNQAIIRGQPLYNDN